MDTNSLKKSDRGTFDFRCDGNVYFCKWNDNAIVSIGSNFTSHIPLSHTKRRVKKDKDCSVTQQILIKEYDIGMGGVDVLDRLLGSYRPPIRGKMWYWPLFINALKVSIVAAWRIHCHVEVSKMSDLDFRQEITLICKYTLFFFIRKPFCFA